MNIVVTINLLYKEFIVVHVLQNYSTHFKPEYDANLDHNQKFNLN